jgi:DNA-binding NarL/FixJ family response regulator
MSVSRGPLGSSNVVAGRGRRPTRVLIVDPNNVYADALHAFLDDHAEIAVVGRAATLKEGNELALVEAPDVILVERRQQDGAGQNICARIRRRLPGTAVIVMSVRDDPKFEIAARRAGAEWLLKGTPGRLIVEAIASSVAPSVVERRYEAPRQNRGARQLKDGLAFGQGDRRSVGD